MFFPLFRLSNSDKNNDYNPPPPTLSKFTAQSEILFKPPKPHLRKAATISEVIYGFILWCIHFVCFFFWGGGAAGGIRTKN